jgi:hypothetical protein
MRRLARPLAVSFTVLSACGGRVVGDDPSGGSGTSAPVNDCAEAIFTKECPPGATVARCKTCSGIPNCHGKESPVIPGFDLTADGLARENHGRAFVNRPADDVNGLCGAAAQPSPISGQVIIDPLYPENSLLYRKVSLEGPSCGTRMPFTAPGPLSDAERKCILDWIKKIPGVNGG